MKRINILFLIIIVSLSAKSQALSSTKNEVRAVWLTTLSGLDWPHSYAQSEYSIIKQQQELKDILDRLQKANINTILFQSRVRGTTIYPSAFEPWDGCLTGVPGKSPGYDPLRFAVDECHKRGMEIHAWMVAVPIGKWNAIGCRNLRNSRSNLVRKIGQDAYMNVENNQTASYLADICAEVATNYDVDGIHLDYIRYPETWKIGVSRDNGRTYITRIVETVSNRVKQLKPWIKMSCSPIGKRSDISRYSSNGWNAYDRVCQDASLWLEKGLMDEIFPMMYFRGNQFFPFAYDWSEQSSGKIVVPGLGIYFMSPKEKNWSLDAITNEMQVLRKQGLGAAYFRSKFFTDNTKDIYNYACTDFYHYPALVPSMTWQHNKRPLAPRGVSTDTKLNCLSWGYNKDMYYNVYSSQDYPVNTSDASNLVMSRLKQGFLYVPMTGKRYYAVTSMDRYGNESEAVQNNKGGQSVSAMTNNMMKCVGGKLELPVNDAMIDADLLLIETLQGNVIASRIYKGTVLNVADIPNGMYVLRSTNRNGKSHKLGFFTVKH